jgi:hypothetical protein
VHRHKPRLAELRLPDAKDTAVEVDIGNAETERLGDAYPGARK